MKRIVMGAVAALIATPVAADYYSSGVYVENYDTLIRNNKVATVGTASSFDGDLDAFYSAYQSAEEAITDYRNDYVEYETDNGYSGFGVKLLHNGTLVASIGPYHAPDSVNRGTCTVNTTSSQNTYWVNHLGIMDFSDVNESLEYHGDRTNGNNMSAASMCWLQWMVNHDVDQLASDVEDMLNYDPGYYASGLTSDYDFIAYYIQFDLNSVVAVPKTFIDTATTHNIDLTYFYQSWVNANKTAAGRTFIQNEVNKWNALSAEQRTEAVTWEFEASVTTEF